MPERFSKATVVATAVLLGLPVLAYLVYSRPGYFTSPEYLGGLLVGQLLLAAVWMYRTVFFPLVLAAFLFAGVNLPVGGGWTVARWVFLAVGALVGSFIMLKERGFRFQLFHGLAAFAALAAVVSALVSRYPTFALLKAASIFLLFVYAGTGARIAVRGREQRFFSGLLTGCEFFVGGLALLYFFGDQVMGNPNSLGAVMGVAGAPILLWGVLLDEKPAVHRRRLALFAICLYMIFHSHSRAAIAAAFVSCGVLCLALRKYKLLGQGVVVILILATTSALIDPETFSDTASTLTNAVVYKGKDPGLGLLSSRESPWQKATESIRDHFWFGSGFGTTENGYDASQRLGKFSSGQGVTAENGSSYLAITTWVGMLGVMPFLFLLLVLIGKVIRTTSWMLNHGSPYHPAAPLAMVIVAGLIHAGFEDWLFAPGYYLCVFFWSLAFMLVDLAPAEPLPGISMSWGSRSVRPRFSGVAPTR
jgi:O-antigen ligase